MVYDPTWDAWTTTPRPWTKIDPKNWGMFPIEVQDAIHEILGVPLPPDGTLAELQTALQNYVASGGDGNSGPTTNSAPYYAGEAKIPDGEENKPPSEVYSDLMNFMQTTWLPAVGPTELNKQVLSDFLKYLANLVKTYVAPPSPMKGPNALSLTLLLIWNWALTDAKDAINAMKVWKALQKQGVKFPNVDDLDCGWAKTTGEFVCCVPSCKGSFVWHTNDDSKTADDADTKDFTYRSYVISKKKTGAKSINVTVKNQLKLILAPGNTAESDLKELKDHLDLSYPNWNKRSTAKPYHDAKGREIGFGVEDDVAITGASGDRFQVAVYHDIYDLAASEVPDWFEPDPKASADRAKYDPKSPEAVAYQEKRTKDWKAKVEAKREAHEHLNDKEIERSGKMRADLRQNDSDHEVGHQLYAEHDDNKQSIMWPGSSSDTPSLMFRWSLLTMLWVATACDAKKAQKREYVYSGPFGLSKPSASAPAWINAAKRVDYLQKNLATLQKMFDKVTADDLTELLAFVTANKDDLP